MTSKPLNPFERWLGRWVAWVCRHALMVAGLSVVLTGLVGFYVATNLGMNTDTADMLSPDLPFRKNSIALSEAFPRFSDNIVIVIDGGNTDQVHDAADRLAGKLRERRDTFGEVFDPAGEPFFRQNGLLYIDPEDLEKLTDRLTAAQPFIGTLWQEPSLSRLFDLLDQVLENANKAKADLPLDAAANVMNAIADVINSQLAGKPKPLAWRDLLSGEKPADDDRRRVILIQPKTNFASLQPGTDAIEAVRRMVSELNLQQDFNVRVRLTGSLALSQEELKSVADGLGIAGILSLVLVLGLLILGLRSGVLVISSLVTLVFGLVWTAGFATLAIGTLNLISVAFAVLFIGLSVDFGIHYCLRFKEVRGRGGSVDAALVGAVESVGAALGWAAVAAAIGFYSFLPTDYLGLAELGLIAGSGMFIALAANLTLLPALISLLASAPGAAEGQLVEFAAGKFNPRAQRKPVLAVFAILVVISLLLSPRARFDFDPLNLKDPKTESVSTLFDLIGSDRHSPYSITILAANGEEARQLTTALAKLKLVESASSVSDLIPKDQETKLDIIQTASLILSPAMNGAIGDGRMTPEETRRSIQDFEKRLTKVVSNPPPGAYGKAARRLHGALNKFVDQGKLEKDSLDELSRLLLSSLPNRLRELRRSLLAEEVDLGKLPASLRDRQIAKDGRVRVDVSPTGNMQDRVQLSAFVAEVTAFDDTATGSPVVILEAGNTVVRAFVQAAITTLILIAGLVLFLTRNVRQIVLIFAPLFVAALLTVSSAIILGLSFNFANVIVLPLLFGLGIAGSIHMVRRENDSGSPADLLSTSTPQAVVFSALTTIGSFGSIALSSHPGTASMGILLTIAIVASLLTTLLLLPALMYVWPAQLGEDAAT